MDDVRRYPPESSTHLLTLDCWHKTCLFHELVEGVVLPGKVVYESETSVWQEHNRKVHGRG